MGSFAAVGSSYDWWGVLDSAGYLMGTTGTIANGADAGMGRLEGVNTASLVIPDPRIIGIPGDNKNKGTMLIESDSPVQGVLTTSIEDSTFVNKSQGTTSFTIGDAVATILGPGCPSFTNLTAIINSPAISFTSGSRGQKGYRAKLFLNIQVFPKSEESMENGNALSFNHPLVGTPVDTFWWGNTVLAADWVATSGLAIDLGFTTYPWTGHTFMGDGAITTMTVDETPAAASAVKVVYWKTGVLKTYTTDYSVVTATKTVTFAVAPAASTKNVILYQYIPVC